MDSNFILAHKPSNNLVKWSTELGLKISQKQFHLWKEPSSSYCGYNSYNCTHQFLYPQNITVTQLASLEVSNLVVQEAQHILLYKAVKKI